MVLRCCLKHDLCLGIAKHLYLQNMAKIKFGAIVTDMRGKVGSQVFSKNKSGAYVRSQKVNVVSSTADQVTVRNRLVSFSQGWRSLNQSDRDAWNNAVDSFRHTNVFGNVINPSGFDLYVKLNFNLDQVGIAPLTLPPLPGLVQNVSSLAVFSESVSPSIFVAYDNSSLSSDHKLILSATACISTGINYVKNRLRVIRVIDLSEVSPLNVSVEYLAKFISITASTRISVSMIGINTVTGQKSSPLSASCIVGNEAGLDFNEALDTGIPLT